jgi:heme exporter protein A
MLPAADTATSPAVSGAPLLAVRELACSRGERQLFSGLSFELGAGEALHVTGGNGSGKTTLLRTLCGLRQPQSGTIFWRGQSASRQPGWLRELRYLGHAGGLKGDLSALENLRVAARLAGAAASEDGLLDALAAAGLAGYEDLPARVLSQGQQHRVQLARLLLPGAFVWVLDEPFTALDVRAVGWLESVLAAHLAGGGMLVLTTHQQVAFTSGVRRLHLGG